MKDGARLVFVKPRKVPYAAERDCRSGVRETVERNGVIKN
jgi:hypothetical protein